MPAGLLSARGVVTGAKSTTRGRCPLRA
jgi:hypothetical protein